MGANPSVDSCESKPTRVNKSTNPSGDLSGCEKVRVCVSHEDLLEEVRPLGRTEEASRVEFVVSGKRPRVMGPTSWAGTNLSSGPLKEADKMDSTQPGGSKESGIHTSGRPVDIKQKNGVGTNEFGANSGRPPDPKSREELSTCLEAPQSLEEFQSSPLKTNGDSREGVQWSWRPEAPKKVIMVPTEKIDGTVRLLYFLHDRRHNSLLELPRSE